MTAAILVRARLLQAATVPAALSRLRERGVPVLALVDGDESVPAHPAIVGQWAVASDRDRPPRPGLILRAARDAGIDLARSWLVGTSADEARAAGQAGLAGCVLVGAAEAPSEDLGIVVAHARDLADAPRVMIPRGGGCWHD